jgi:magnesium-transporting ATPase (P-type)
MNKRGNVVLDMITWGVWLFVIALVAVIGVMVANQVNDKLQLSELGTEAKDNLQGTTERYDNTLDNMFFLAFVMLWIFVFIASFMQSAHPIFFAIMLFLTTFVFIVIAVLSNTFGSMR